MCALVTGVQTCALPISARPLLGQAPTRCPAHCSKGVHMFDNKNVATLNSLIATTLDSIDGYRKAADETNAAGFRDIFLSRANERQSVVANLQAKVRELGGEPEDDGTALASAHRAFLGLRDKLTGDRSEEHT